MRPSSAPWTTRGASLALVLALVVPATPVKAAPEASAPAEPPATAAEGGTPSSTPGEGETPEPNAGATTPGESEEGSVETQPPPSTVAGMGSSVISSNNPEARRARADLEGTAVVTTPQSGVPERMRPLQRAAWWTVFSTFALATSGGLFAGYAEVQEDRAQRLASTLDPTTGGQYLYADKQAEYDDLLAKGERQQWIARGLLIGAGLTAIAAVTIFAIDAKRQKRAQPTALRRGLRLGRGGVEVHF